MLNAKLKPVIPESRDSMMETGRYEKHMPTNRAIREDCVLPVHSDVPGFTQPTESFRSLSENRVGAHMLPRAMLAHFTIVQEFQETQHCAVSTTREGQSPE
jgi:hypothetical protein